MGSAQQDSSNTSSSIFIPNWVKNKCENSGFDPSALSPPNYDSDFFYVKFPKAEKSETCHQKQDKVNDQFLGRRELIKIVSDPIKPNILKAMGIENGSDSMPQKIISGGNPPIRGFTTDDAAEVPPGKYFRQRRNSKSLPASPIVSPETSPLARRKNALQNRFPVATIAEADEQKKSRSSWMLSGLFSLSRDSGLFKEADGKKDEESRGFANLDVRVEVKPPPVIDKKVYMKKRSEIRELNIMSPVSM